MTDFHIQWHITDACNLRCIDCYQENHTTSNDLNITQLKSVCDNIISAMAIWKRRATIALTGGEPLLKKELWDVIEYLNSSEYVHELSIITNGTFIDNFIPKLKEYKKLNKIYISLDGVTVGTNDLVRGEGTFKKTVDNIKILMTNDIPVTIMYTVLRHNFYEAKLMHEIAKNLKVDGYIVERFIPLGQGRKIIDEVISGEQIEDLFKHIINLCDSEYSPGEVIKYHALMVKFNHVRPGYPDSCFGAECIVGRDGMAVLPDGTVLPCRRFNMPLGNILEKSLDDIWSHSEVLENLRDKKNIKGKCGSCEIKECIGCRAMTYALTGDYLQEDPHCYL